jgi:hypothetical protein
MQDMSRERAKTDHLLRIFFCNRSNSMRKTGCSAYLQSASSYDF